MNLPQCKTDGVTYTSIRLQSIVKLGFLCRKALIINFCPGDKELWSKRDFEVACTRNTDVLENTKFLIEL